MSESTGVMTRKELEARNEVKFRNLYEENPDRSSRTR